MSDNTPDAPQPEQPAQTPQFEQAYRVDEQEQTLRPGGGEHESPWHPVHVSNLVMGIAFLGLVAVLALVVPLDAVQLPHARWLLPLPWLVAGAAGVIATVISRRRRP